MLDYLLFLSLFTLAFSAGIVMKSAERVQLGQDAAFSCQLPGAMGVKQVTWQQLSENDGSVQKMVTFDERLMHDVAEPYLGKVEVTQMALNASAIIIRNVTFADQTCYVCTFNAYPSGTKRKKACLMVEGVSAMTVSVMPLPNSPTMTSVSCSATGKPTPVISWNLTGEYEQENTSTLINDDGTETTTSRIIPTLLGQAVQCVSQSGKGGQSKTVYVDHTDQSDHTETDVKSRSYIASIVVICLLAIGTCLTVVFHKRRKNLEKFAIDVV